MNCWEYKKCGRELGGAKVAELGVCPAARLFAGEACWLIAGTFCGGEVQGTDAKKLAGCLSCDFYMAHTASHRAQVREQWADRV